jgi:hypothetical protein
MSHPSPLSLDESRSGDVTPNSSPLTPHPSPLTEFSEEGEAVEGYRPFCGLAIAGVVLGGFSVLACKHEFFWCIAFTGVVVNGLALWRIAASGGLQVGRRAALIGLTCSLLFGSIGVTRSVLRPVVIHGEARQFAEQWFAELREGDSRRVHQQAVLQWRREPADEDLAGRYEQSPKLQAMLATYVKKEPVRTLLALGRRGQVRFVRNEQLKVGWDEYDVDDVYQVNVDGDGSEGARLIKLELRCLPDLLRGGRYWDLKRATWLETPPASWAGR